MSIEAPHGKLRGMPACQSCRQVNPGDRRRCHSRQALAMHVQTIFTLCHASRGDIDRIFWLGRYRCVTYLYYLEVFRNS